MILNRNRKSLISISQFQKSKSYYQIDFDSILNWQIVRPVRNRFQPRLSANCPTQPARPYACGNPRRKISMRCGRDRSMWLRVVTLDQDGSFLMETSIPGDDLRVTWPSRVGPASSSTAYSNSTLIYNHHELRTITTKRKISWLRLDDESSSSMAVQAY